VSNYGDMYRARDEEYMISGYCPKWAATESRQVRLALSEGAKAKKELAELRTALGSIKRLMR
jgi:hypothetical protein